MLRDASMLQLEHGSIPTMVTVAARGRLKRTIFNQMARKHSISLLERSISRSSMDWRPEKSRLSTFAPDNQTRSPFFSFHTSGQMTPTEDGSAGICTFI